MKHSLLMSKKSKKMSAQAGSNLGYLDHKSILVPATPLRLDHKHGLGKSNPKVAKSKEHILMIFRS